MIKGQRATLGGDGSPVPWGGVRPVSETVQWTVSGPNARSTGRGLPGVAAGRNVADRRGLGDVTHRGATVGVGMGAEHLSKA